MKFMSFFSLFFVYVMTSIVSLKASQPVLVEDDKMLQHIEQNLSLEGVLKDNGKGYVYVKVDDEYIYDLFPMIRKEGYAVPPYFRGKNSPGAHISVFYVEETKNLPDIQEIGRTFSFETDRVVEVRAGRDVSYIVLQVKSPELEALRTKYGLKPLLQGHEFHITIGKKVHRA